MASVIWFISMLRKLESGGTIYWRERNLWWWDVNGALVAAEGEETETEEDVLQYSFSPAPFVSID